MAQSPSSSTSDKPSILNLELADVSIPNTTLSDPISADLIVPIHHSQSPENAPDCDTVEVAGEDAAIAEEVEFRNAIERELSQLTIQQAQIEAAIDDDDEAGSTDAVTVVKDDNLDDEGKDEEIVEDENMNDDENVEVKVGEGSMNVGRYINNQSNHRRRINYPLRPDGEDCGHYMKFGSCKFGMNCKFNHPARRNNQAVVKERSDHREDNSHRAGQTECKYYLTPGGCKYGNDCKFSHGSDNNSTAQISELNFLGLPIRPGEKECPYYMRTGSCKYESSCRFHHPDSTTVNGGVDSPSGYGNGASLPSKLVSSSPVSSWSSPRAFNEPSPFVPVMFPPTQGGPASNTEWNGYQAATYSTSERSLPTPPAFAMNNLPPEINFSMPHHQHDLVVEEYPERPGELECSFFLKTGDCKFKSNCKFHHPKSHSSSRPKPNTYVLSDKGLLLRPDQPICTQYHRYGICKYGPACKYDHPSQFAILPPPFDRPPYGNLNIRRGNGS